MLDWRELVLRIYLDRSPDEVFDMWADGARLEEWFLTKASYDTQHNRATEGARYRWEWAEGTIEEGEVVQCDAGSLIAFTFGADTGTVVSFVPARGGTLVELRQEHSHDDEEARAEAYVGCLQGWTFYLANLRSILAAGPDLRERQPDIDNLVNV